MWFLWKMDKNTHEQAGCKEADSSVAITYVATTDFAKLLKKHQVWTHTHTCIHGHTLLHMVTHTLTHTHGNTPLHILQAAYKLTHNSQFVNGGPMVIRSPVCNDA